MGLTQLQVHKTIRDRLKTYKKYQRQTYNEVLTLLMDNYDVKNKKE